MEECGGDVFFMCFQTWHVEIELMGLIYERRIAVVFAALMILQACTRLLFVAGSGRRPVYKYSTGDLTS